MKLFSVIVRKPDGAQSPIARTFNQLSNDGEHFCKGPPARINRRMLSTASEESRPDAFCASFALNIGFAGNCVIDSIALFLEWTRPRVKPSLEKPDEFRQRQRDPQETPGSV
jgi:hypothetical protein